MTSGPQTFGDSELTAYLDGELDEAARRALEARLATDAALAARLKALRASGTDLPAAMDALLDAAPEAQLRAVLANASAERSRRVPWRRDMVMRLAAAALVIFVAGGAVGLFLPRLVGINFNAPEPPNWRAAVADYLALYTRDTLASIPDDAAMRAEELSVAGARLALDLTPEKLDLPNLALKRAQLFQYNGKALAQIAYLGAEDGAIAFCIIASGAPDAPPKFEAREGQNIVFWAKGGRGYLVIGRAPREQLEPLAARLQSSVS
jgi:anti-sigma factor RsiW